MLNIGCHLSSAKGYLHMLRETESIGGNTFQKASGNLPEIRWQTILRGWSIRRGTCIISIRVAMSDRELRLASK